MSRREVSITADPELLARAFALRWEVFTVGQGIDPVIERDGKDAAAIHAVLVDPAGVVVGTGRLLDEGDHARLGRIAVSSAERGRGTGRLVVEALEQVARSLGLPRVRLHAQQDVVGFYERLQYVVSGPPDLEAGISHRWMERDLLPGLREVTDQDGAAVQALVGGCFAEYPGCVLDLDGVDMWMRAPDTRRGAAGAFWVCADGPGLVASVGWGPAEGGLELKSLYVAAPARRRGYGKALVGLVERAARQRGVRSVELWTDTRFTDAHRLYARLGYVRLPGIRELGDPSRTVEYHFSKII